MCLNAVFVLIPFSQKQQAKARSDYAKDAFAGGFP